MPDDYDVLVARCANLRFEPIDTGKTYLGLTLIDEGADDPPTNAPIKAVCLRRVRCRTSPSAVSAANFLGQYVEPDDEVVVLEERQVDGHHWLRIGYNQWCALRYGQTIFMEYAE